MIAREYGVRVLFVDRVAGAPPPNLRNVARLVFVNPAADVFSVSG